MDATKKAARNLVMTGIIALVGGGALLLALPQLINRSISSSTTAGLQAAGVGLLIAAAALFLARRPGAKFTRIMLRDAARGLAAMRGAAWGFVQSESRWHLIVLGVFLLAGVGLRLLFISQPMRTDESLTYLQFASKPLYLALSDYAAPNNHLFHTFFVFVSTRLLGDAEWAIRLPAFIAGVLSIPLTYIGIRRLYNPSAALLAAGLVATSSPLIEYAANARGYTLQTALFLGALITAESLRRSTNRAGWTLLALLLALGFYTIPTMVYAAGGLLLWLLLEITLGTKADEQRRLLLHYGCAVLGAAALTVALYTPVFVVSGASAITGNIYVQSPGFSEFIGEVPDLISQTAGQWHRSMPLPLAILVGLGAVGAVFFHRRLARSQTPLLPLSLIWIGLVLLVQQVIPFTRVWLFLLPVYLGSAAAGWMLARRWLPTHRRQTGWLLACTAVTAMLAAGILVTRSPYTSLETGTFRDAPQVARLLADRLQEGDRVIYEHPSGESLRYYFQREGIAPEYIHRDFTAHPRLFVVVNTEYPQDVASVLAENAIRAEQYGEPQPLYRLPQAEIYLLVKDGA